MKKVMLLSLITVHTMVMYGLCDKSNKNCCGKSSSTIKKTNTQNCNTKEIIKEAYAKAVTNGQLCTLGGGCCGGGGELSKTIGYTNDELKELADANLGLGCGHPVNLGQIKEGEIVLDLGSGAGLDCFLAIRKTGISGKVIGIDMTEEMIKKAQDNAKKYNISNVEFRLGDIENMPVDTHSIDIVISNCVINLAPNKEKVFKEAYRVLKPGGRMAISDVVLTGPLSEQQKNDTVLLCACVSGALLKKDYIATLEKIGFAISIIEEDEKIGKKWFGEDNDLPISSLKFIAYKQ